MIILTKVNKNNIYNSNNIYSSILVKIIHLINKFKNLIFDDNDNNYYDYFEYKKFKDYFIEYYYDEILLKNIKYLNDTGKKHKENGPAYIQYYKNGEINTQSYYIKDKRYSYEDYLIEINKLV